MITTENTGKSPHAAHDRAIFEAQLAARKPGERLFWPGDLDYSHQERIDLDMPDVTVAGTITFAGSTIVRLNAPNLIAGAVDFSDARTMEEKND